MQWLWTYLTGQRGSVLLVNHHASPQPEGSRQVAPSLNAIGGTRLPENS
jgi:hypothetical protein